MELQLDLALSTGTHDCHSGSPSFDVDETPALHNHRQESTFSKRNGGVREDFIVGWPPVKSWRKQLCHHNRRACATNVENGGGGRATNSMYVKVKMEGVGITRKIDLSSHRSFRALASKLIALFGKCRNSEYKLMYQNNEGEWLNARDVPWECFIRSAQRLKLEKNGY